MFTFPVEQGLKCRALLSDFLFILPSLIVSTPAPSHIVIAQPALTQQLFLLFHGLGDSAQGLAPLGRFIAAHFPQAAVISIDSPYFCDVAAGYQWYSVQGATEDDRHALVAEQMPHFVDMVQHWQRLLGVPPEATCLVGFSQGAFMSLQSTQQNVFLAGRVVALAGRFTAAPNKPAHPVVIHMLHGDQDTVVAHHHSVAASERLQALGADVTIDVLAGLAHGINEEMAQAIIRRLTSYIPQRIWNEALGAAGQS